MDSAGRQFITLNLELGKVAAPTPATCIAAIYKSTFIRGMQEETNNSLIKLLLTIYYTITATSARGLRKTAFMKL